jgi:ABC-type phosphate transport system substrate-binding protein
MVKITARCLLSLALWGGSRLHAEELVVIVSPAAPAINKEELRDLYLGRGSGWTLLDQDATSAIYVEFYKRVIGRDPAQVKAIWSKILFTGRGLPPKQLPDSGTVKKAVAANPNAVGYIEKSAVDASVKVVLAVD